MVFGDEDRSRKGQLDLYSKDVGSVGETTRLFGHEKGLLVARPARFFRPWFGVPEGCYALVTKFGQDYNYPTTGSPVWPPGLHHAMSFGGFSFMFPFVKISNLVSKQSVVFNMPVKGCKTQDNVTVQINLSIVFRIMGDEAKGEDPALVRNFVYKVTPRGLEQQLVDACEEATRSVARGLMHTEVYGLRTDMSGKRANVLRGQEEGEVTDEGDVELRTAKGPGDDEAAAAAMSKGSDVAANMRRSLNDQFQPQGVEITDVIITDVGLPDTIVQQMSEKTMVISQNAAQKMNQEYELLTLKQQEEIETLKQRKREDREKEKQSGDQRVNEIQVQLDKMKAETKVRLAKIQQESAATVQNIIADGQLEVAKLEQQKMAVLTEMKAKAQAEAQKMKSETDVFEEERLSEARLQATRNVAQISESMAKAEGVAAPYVEARKQFETRHKQMKIWEKLAANKDLVISGEENPELNTLLLSDAIIGDMPAKDTKSQVLAEMLVMQRGSKVMLNLDKSGSAL